MKNKKWATILLLSLVTNILFVGVAGYFIYSRGGISYIVNKVNAFTGEESTKIDTYYSGKYELFKTFDQKEHAIVFLGDSLTDGNEWSEMFPNQNVINRGISSDNTQGVINRIKEVVNRKPSKLFVMIGINDIIQVRKIDGIIEDYKEIIETVENDSTETKIYIQSVLPANNDVRVNNPVDNEKIVSLNKFLKEYADDKGITYIDIYSMVVDENNQLYSAYTTDGLHLSSEGYYVWKDTIEQFISQ